MKTRYLTRAIIVLILFCFAIPLFAETAESDDADINVVVTATRIAQSAALTPANVTVITKDDIARSGATSVLEVLSAAGGIDVTATSEAPATSSLTMRGGGDGKIVVLLDGRRMNNPDMSTINWLDVPLSRVKRIEVVRGAGSVVYGDNAVAGVVNIITGDEPTPETQAEPGFSLSAYGGSFGMYGGHAGITYSDLPFTLNATYTTQGSNGQRERSENAAQGISASFGLSPSDALDVETSLSYSTTSYQLPGAISASEYVATPDLAVNSNDDAAATKATAGITASYQTGPLTVTLPLFYRYSMTAADYPSYFTPTYIDNGINRLEGHPTAEQSWYPGVSYRFTLRGGTDLLLDTLHVTRYASESRNTADFNGTLTKNSAGGWTQLELSYEDRVIFQAGARLERARVDASSPDAPAVEGSVTHVGSAYEFGFIMRPRPDLRFFMRTNSVYRYPFLDEQVSYSGYPPGGAFYAGLDPERGFNVETGAEISVGPALGLSTSVYRLALRDEIAWDGNTSQNVNLDQTTRTGGELRLTLHPLPWLELSGTYAYVSAIYAAGPNEGNHVPLVPAHTASGHAVITLPAGFSFTPELRYTGPYYVDDANAGGSHFARTLLNATVNWSVPGTSADTAIFLAVDNILDDRDPTAAFYSAGPPATISVYPLSGRALRAGFRWGY